MPRGSTPLLLGFIGSGKINKKSVEALLDDLIETKGGEARFVFPVTPDLFNPNLKIVMDYAIDREIPFDAVHDTAGATDKALGKYLAAADGTHKIVNVANKVVAMLAKGDGDLIVLWDDEDEDAGKATEKALDAKLKAYDLTMQLERLEFEDDDAEEEDKTEIEDDEPEEEEEPKPRGRRGAKAKDSEPDEEEEEDEEPPAKPARGRARTAKAKDPEPEAEDEGDPGDTAVHLTNAPLAAWGPRPLENLDAAIEAFNKTKTKCKNEEVAKFAFETILLHG